MIPFTPITATAQSNQTASAAGAGKPADAAQFQALLLQVRLQQMQAWSGIDGGEGSEPDLPGLGRNYGILNLLASRMTSAGAQPDYVKQRGLEQYRAADTANAMPLSAPGGDKPSIRQWAAQAAGAHGVPATLFEKLIGRESSFNPAAVSPKGAMGLGQLMPSTAKEMGLKLSGGFGSVWDPQANLNASAGYLRRLYDLYRDKGIGETEAWNFAAGAYNAGMGNIQKAIDKLSTEQPPVWQQVAAVLPEVTGASSRETIAYVDHLRTL